jgi:hypothetical protein
MISMTTAPNGFGHVAKETAKGIAKEPGGAARNKLYHGGFIMDASRDAFKVPQSESGSSLHDEVSPGANAEVLSAEQSRFVFEHSTCAMCDTTLEVRHQVNRTDLKVREEAHCPSCGIRVRSAHHLMH